MQSNLKKIINFILTDDPKKACRRFNVINAISKKYPISLKPLECTDSTGTPTILLEVSDSKHTFTISRPSRISLYRNGIKTRLEILHKLYLLQHIHFKPEDIVIDCGANVGEVTFYLQQKYDVHAICIEPETLEVAALKNNTTDKTEIHQALLWRSRTVLSFYQGNDSGDSSIFKSNKADKTVEQEAYPLTDLVKKHPQFQKTNRIKLLKLEAEGAEPEILEGAREVLPRIEYVSVDCGPERGAEQENTLIACLNILLEHDFEPVMFNHERMVLLCKNKRFK